MKRLEYTIMTSLLASFLFFPILLKWKVIICGNSAGNDRFMNLECRPQYELTQTRREKKT